MIARSLFIAAFAITIGGCSTPPHALSESGDSRTFVASEPSDAVYRRIVEGARKCYARYDIAADFFPDNRSGRVSMSVKTALNISALFTAEISTGPAGSSVTVRYLKGNPTFADAVEQWTRGKYALCPFA